MAETDSGEKKRIGEVVHYFTNLGVCVIKLSDSLKKGDRISVEGSTTNFQQQVESMQIDRNDVEEAAAGQEAAIKTAEKAREGDIVYKI